jgi:peptide/nickel transport system ATP-binding protein/oligopeptide transport system ATP-binding protein
MSDTQKPAEEPLLQIRDLRTYFFTDQGVARSVDGVSYTIPRGKTLGVVGESGCGKSVTAMSIVRLIPMPPGEIASGEILFDGRDLTKLTEAQMRDIRGNDISVIFQEPMTSLNPVYTVGDQIMEAIMLHQGKEPEEAYEIAIEMLTKVGIPSPRTRVDEYPHQMSGGMKQRVMIAMALACRPKLLIADEPTTALDVTIQAQILELLNQLQEEFGMSVLLITHDLGVVAETCDYVVVMYGGQVVEQSDVHALFNTPRHPYTRALFRSLPHHTGGRQDRLETIEGLVPSPMDFPSGCRFRTRCRYATEKCAELPPTLDARTPGATNPHWVACHYSQEVVEGAKAETGPYDGGGKIETRAPKVREELAALRQGKE